MSAFESHFCSGNGYLKLGNVKVLLNFDSQMKIKKILKLEGGGVMSKTLARSRPG